VIKGECDIKTSETKCNGSEIDVIMIAKRC